MPLSAAPRSVSDATRFTATTPHASSKAAASAPAPRFASPKSGSGSRVSFGGAGGSSSGGGNAGPPPLLETPEQKVARLRAAHLRAKEAQVSKLDKVISASRRVFDRAHRVTVLGLVGFTFIAAFATAYTAFDMITYNKKRSAEWVERQKQLEADELAAARIAYMTGKANEEQIALVEEQLAREREAGRRTSFFSSMPSILGTPEPAGSSPSSSSSSSPSSPSAPSAPASTFASAQPATAHPQRITETVSWPAADEHSEPQQQEQEQGHTRQQKTGLWAWLTANLKREEEADNEDRAMSPRRRLGWESLSEEDDRTGVRDSDMARAVETRQAQLRAKAQAAFEKEKENQRRGGPLDRLGVEDAQMGEEGPGATGSGSDAGKAGEVAGQPVKKKGWLW